MNLFCLASDSLLIFLGPDLFWLAKGTQTQTSWMDEAQCFPHLRHFVQTGYARSLQFSKETMAVLDPRRGSAYQEFQVSEVATFAQFPKRGTFAINGNPVAKQPYGAVVLDAFPDAEYFRVPQGLQGMVFQSFDWHGRG